MPTSTEIKARYNAIINGLGTDLEKKMFKVIVA